MNKLGERLAAPGPISDEDYVLLAQIAQDYQNVLDKVEEKLQALGYQATTRVKTTGTLVDKLRRSPHLRFKAIHDVAGARIVIDGGRWEQDQVVDRIAQAFEGCPRSPDRIDRRENPSHGYRAYHVVVYEEGIPVEIQVRTKLQDTWAQVTEKLGDAWGRGLRYGLGPDQPDASVLLVSGEDAMTRGEVMGIVATFSEVIDEVESVQHKIDRIQVPFDGHKKTMQALTERLLAVVSTLGSSE